MAIKDRPTLKALFENGDKPQGQDFADHIDSMVALSDTTAQSMASKLEGPEFATSKVSAVDMTISGDVTYTGETTVAAVASGAVTVPASALGYITVTVSGRTVAMPYYAV